MNVQPIEMDPHVARRAYLEYRERCIDHREQRRAKLDKKRTMLEREDEELRAAYRALSHGQRVINVAHAFRGAGVDALHRPKLAIGRAGTDFVFFRRLWRRGAEYGFGHHEDVRYPMFTLRRETFPEQTRQINTLRAVVPAIPAHLRPAKQGEYFILWEPTWEPVAPEDPLLLKRISGDMFAVLAQWDLSPVEKMVLEGRFSAR